MSTGTWGTDKIQGVGELREVLGFKAVGVLGFKVLRVLGFRVLGF